MTTDPVYNPDCREFYNKSGQVSYHLYTRTISCSQDCHPYRRAEKNIDPDLDQSACTSLGSQAHWDGESCVFCKNGGVWNPQHEACIYMAISGEGRRCSASQNGCREYSGNKGSNMRIILNNDFEGSTQSWEGEIASEALTAGGNSLKVNDSTNKILGTLVQKGRSYVLSFIAKKDTAGQFNLIKLINGDDDEALFNISVSALSNKWQIYKFNLDKLDHEVSEDESLAIQANGNFYIDDIRLTEIIDRYYLIKNSWQTPDSCDQDINGNPFPLYMLGCDQYRDRDNRVHNLRGFSELCQESAVGCELMIDTHNSENYKEETIKGITISEDSFTYVVYDRDKQCNQADKGCERFGGPYEYEGQTIYNDVYLKNNPDKYSEILCTAAEVGCEKWVSQDGDSYFKGPGVIAKA